MSLPVLSDTTAQQTYIQYSDGRLPAPGSGPNTIVDPSKPGPGAVPPSYHSPHPPHISPETAMNGTTMMPIEQRDIHIPGQMGFPVTMYASPAAPNPMVMQPNPALYPSVPPQAPPNDAATIGARYKAECM